MTRPRLCYICAAPGVIADECLLPYVVLRLDGTTKERGLRWQARYLCAEHQNEDAWRDA